MFCDGVMFSEDQDVTVCVCVCVCACVCVCRLVSQGDVLTVPAENHPDLLENNSEGIHRYQPIRSSGVCC